jgi:uncharacterized protein (TIGR02453 family)
MPERPDLQKVISFVQSLKQNNNREWFQDHKPQYEEARLHFEDYVGALIEALAPTEALGDLSPKDCIFRIYRDLRFSKDKTPYKPYMSAYIAPGGRKSRRFGLYVHLEAGDESIIAGGLHDPDPQLLGAWRASIDRDPRPFKKIVNSATFRKYFGSMQGDSLKTAPRGYPKDHPEIELLRLKQVTAWRKMSDKQVISPTMLRETLDTFKAMKPFLAYFQDLR